MWPQLQSRTGAWHKKGHQHGSKRATKDGFFAYWKIGGGQIYTTGKKSRI